MYNTEIKERYLKYKNDESISPNDNLRRMFLMLAQFEKKLSKDVCNFTGYEIENMYKTINYATYESLSSLNSNLKRYTGWCQSEGLVIDGLNHYEEFDREQLLGYINKALFNKRIVTRDELLIRIKSLPNYSDAFIVLAIFEGIKGRELSELDGINIEQIKGNEIKLNSGRTINISDELIELAHKSSEEDEYSTITSTETKTVKRVGLPGQIIKELPRTSDGNFYNRMIHRIKRIFDYLDMSYMKITQLQDSGKIEMIKSKAAEMNLPAIDCALKVKEDILRQYGNAQFKTSDFVSKYSEFLE